MGYYSTLAIDHIPCDYDCSYTPPEKQLLWRLEELQDRFEELTVKNRTYESRICFSPDDLRYVLPEHFKSATDVAAAIELAISDLRDQYGICVCEEEHEEEPVIDEITGMQISFLDILSVCSQYSSPCAA